MSPGLRSVRAALRRMERAAGKGQRHCPWCRLNYRHGWPDPKLPRPRPEDLIRYRCELCGTEMLFSLSNLPEEERELQRLSHSFTMEEAYTSPAPVALEVWLSIHPKRKNATGRGKAAAEADGRDPGTRLLATLREEEKRLFERKRRRLAARHGDPTKRVLEVIASVQNSVRDRWQARCDIPGLRELVNEQAVYLICAELEKIIWGRVRPETAILAEDLEQKITRLVEEERARLRAEEEEARRRMEEEEAERLRQAAREAAERALIEAEVTPRQGRNRYGRREPYDPMRGMHVFDFEAYERQIASGKHPSGRVPQHLG